MNRVLLIIPLVVLMSTPMVLAQSVSLVFGPLEGDSAGTIYAVIDGRLDVDVWIRTVPGISIIALHLPLSCNDYYIQSDSIVRGELYYPLNESWNIDFCLPNPDDHNPGYTNRSIFGYCSSPEGCEYPIQTDGEWWKIAQLSFTAAEGDGTPHCDVFMEGYHPDFGNPILVDFYQGELDPSDYETNFACLSSGGCYYLVGDWNGNGVFNIADVIAALSKLKTGQPNADHMCECLPNSGRIWPIAMDLNNSCAFNIADIVVGFSKLKTGHPELTPCEYCPPLN